MYLGGVGNVDLIMGFFGITSTIYVVDSSMQKLNPLLLGHPTVKLERFIQSFRLGDLVKEKIYFIEFV